MYFLLSILLCERKCRVSIMCMNEMESVSSIMFMSEKGRGCRGTVGSPLEGDDTRYDRRFVIFIPRVHHRRLYVFHYRNIRIE